MSLKPKHRWGRKLFTLLAITGGVGYALISTPTPKNTFHPFTVVSKEQLTPSTYILTLRLPKNFPSLPYSSNKFVSLEVKDPSMQISRFYTPLPAEPGTETAGERLVRLYFRRYERGPISGLLGRSGEDSQIEIRGPKTDAVMPQDAERILAIVGGTGVTTALQGVGKVGEMRVLYCVRNKEEAGLWRRFVPSGAKGVSVSEFVDREGGLRDEDVRDVLEEWKNKEGKNYVIVSGPDGFIKYWAGPKNFVEGRETQGELGGVLGSLIGKEEQDTFVVWKFS